VSVRTAAVVLALACTAAPARAENSPAPAAPERAVVDRVVVRFYAPETGGITKPRFITERVLAFESRLEAVAEGAPDDAREERFLRSAIDRHVAEEMLANLMIERGSEPKDLPALSADARKALADRVGGEAALEAFAAREGLGEDEIVAMIRRKVRAAYYIDRALAPILHPSEEELREAFRTSLHPYRSGKFEEVQEPLRRWVVYERLRVAEVAFLQAARSRVRILVVPR
jgi:hypothetical protein